MGICWTLGPGLRVGLGLGHGLGLGLGLSLDLKWLRCYTTNLYCGCVGGYAALAPAIISCAGVNRYMEKHERQIPE